MYSTEAGCARPAYVPRKFSGTPASCWVKPLTWISYTIVSVHGVAGLGAGSGSRGLNGHHRARHERGGVGGVARTEQRRRSGVRHLGEVAFQPATVGVEEELVDVVAEALLGIPRARRSEAVALTRADVGDKGVPHAVRWAVEREASLFALRVEEAQEHAGCVRGPDAYRDAAIDEVDAEALGRGGVCECVLAHVVIVPELCVRLVARAAAIARR